MRKLHGLPVHWRLASSCLPTSMYILHRCWSSLFHRYNDPCNPSIPHHWHLRHLGIDSLLLSRFVSSKCNRKRCFAIVWTRSERCRTRTLWWSGPSRMNNKQASYQYTQLATMDIIAEYMEHVKCRVSPLRSHRSRVVRRLFWSSERLKAADGPLLAERLYASLKKERYTASHDRLKIKEDHYGIKKKVGNEGDVPVTKGQPGPRLLSAGRRWNTWFRGLSGSQRS
jgi:hypothetical protein